MKLTYMYLHLNPTFVLFICLILIYIKIFMVHVYFIMTINVVLFYAKLMIQKNLQNHIDFKKKCRRKNPD